MIRRPPRSTLSSSSAASDVYKRQVSTQSTGEHNTHEMALTRNLLAVTLAVATICISAVHAQADKCSESEFEAPHHEWGPSCVARFVTHIGLKHKADTFLSNDIVGSALKGLNATSLEALNITKTSEQQTLMENISRLERHNPASNGESIFYLPLMFAGCGTFIYIMFLKGSDFERTMLRNLRRITKKAKASHEGGMIDKDDWLKGTAASQGQGKARSRKK
eukprot:TRINITY_DN70_c0_g1_i1.p1 TRINITY_DN70_c0_g1~~TRINITY_DN70_c0_g1_i1.p1  ORF type:complete len:221 (+),score=63.33 TRINITY_DN70_c0_g1_i1:96-758(+)